MSRRESLPALLMLVLLACAAIGSVRGSRHYGFGYNTARPPLDAEAHPYKGRVEDTATVAPPGVREARLVCDPVGPLYRIITCEIHTFDLCGNPEGEAGNITQWTTRVESMTARQTNAHVAPIIWIARGIARFYFTPTVTGQHVVTVRRGVSLPNQPLNTPALMVFPVMVHESIVTCTGYRMEQPPRATQAFLWAQSSRDNERAPIYGLEPSTSDRTFVFGDKRRQFGAGIASGYGTPTGRDPVQPFQVGTLGDMPRLDDSAFRYCDYVQRSMGR